MPKLKTEDKITLLHLAVQLQQPTKDYKEIYKDLIKLLKNK